MPVARSTKEVEASAFALEKYRLDRAHELELNKATATYEQETLKILSYLNGGGAFIYAAFVGNMLKDRPGALATGLLTPVAFWAAGLVFAALSLWIMYESQVKFAQAYHSRRRAEEKRNFQDLPKYANVTDPAKSESKYEDEGTAHRAKGSRIKQYAKLAGLASLLLFVAGLVSLMCAIARIA